MTFEFKQSTTNSIYTIAAEKLLNEALTTLSSSYLDEKSVNTVLIYYHQALYYGYIIDILFERLTKEGIAVDGILCSSEIFVSEEKSLKIFEELINIFKNSSYKIKTEDISNAKVLQKIATITQ